MAGPDFRALLSKPMDDIKKPPPLPAGTFLGRQLKFDFVESKEKKTPGVQFTYQLTGFGDDIDPSQQDGVDLSKRTVRHTFWISEDSVYRLKDYIASTGVDCNGKTLGESLPETANAEVLIEMIQKPGEKAGEIFNELKDVRGSHGV